MSDTIAPPALDTSSGPKLSTVFWLAGALFCVAFAIMVVWFPVAIAFGRHDIWTLIQGAFTSADYSFGPHSAEAKHAVYLHALRGLSLHTIAGGAALLAATTQFVPSFRRRWPRLHRTTGALVVVLVAVSMIGSLIIQASHPLAATLSGAGFGIGLASLGGLTLTELALAVLAIRARDYRSHMGWMALMFASLLTAPTLRLQWLAFGGTGLTLEEANLVIAVYLVPMTVLLMTFWMLTVAARDLGLAPTRSILPQPALRVLAALSALVALHEGCLAPLGLDLIHAWRGAGHLLPTTGIVWGLATAGLALRAPRDLQRLDASEGVRGATTMLAVVAALGGVLVAATAKGGDLQALAERSFYAAWGLEVGLLVLLARCAALGRAAPWAAKALYLAFAPALWPALACSYAPLGVGAAVALPTSMAIAFATIAVLGFASAFGLRVAVPRRRSAPLAEGAAAA